MRDHHFVLSQIALLQNKMRKEGQRVALTPFEYNLVVRHIKNGDNVEQAIEKAKN